MKCMYCGHEMQKGTVSFLPVQGFGAIMISFTSDEEKQKSFFKRETKEKLVFAEETEAYYCTCCNKIMPIIDADRL